MPFQFTQLTPSVIQVKHHGPITLDDSRHLRQTLNDLEGMLLIDLYDTPIGDSFKEFCRVRALLPKTAFYGPPDSDVVCKTLPGKDFYMHEARHFTDREAALNWLLAEGGEDREDTAGRVA
jgi:hypothetical protein